VKQGIFVMQNNNQNTCTFPLRGISRLKIIRTTIMSFIKYSYFQLIAASYWQSWMSLTSFLKSKLASPIWRTEKHWAIFHVSITYNLYTVVFCCKNLEHS